MSTCSTCLCSYRLMPRRKKSFSVRKRSKSAPAILTRTRRPGLKRKVWDSEQMEAALWAVGQGQSVTRAARNHGVPKTTLFDRVSGRVTHGVKPGPRPYLSPNEEKELGAFLKDCSKIGYGKTRRDVLSIAQSVANDVSMVSKFLSLPASTPARPNAAKPKGRLLTSAEVLGALEEKEKKKQQKIEEKERKKKE